jgi:hypothetical protein
MATDNPPIAELDRCTAACTAFRTYAELLEKCTRQNDPYVPTMSPGQPEAVMVGKALEAGGCRVYWTRVFK